MRKRRACHAAVFVTLAAFFCAHADAADVDVRMVNRGPDHPMQFQPELLLISPGDTVHFVAIDTGHNAESIPGMIPQGAQRFNGVMGQNLAIMLTVPGVYGYRCAPHGATGMVGLIVVGAPVNEPSAKQAQATQTAPARRVFEKLFADLDQRTIGAAMPAASLARNTP